ncbi:hypothetical protein GCM10007939_01550 [Amylibacter marinus]|uniref:DUF2497 domain-containing protein n=1 Tax=Amylibacter marinus TaxID=1475483 RepID=A0ABQ5VRW4_9RHOB|nr:hypothetical protein [Amylibacter marinus]GLQ33872.1 hypothetical protein GCM10007939_01550 [Amylibacter marinus]
MDELKNSLSISATPLQLRQLISEVSAHESEQRLVVGGSRTRAMPTEDNVLVLQHPVRQHDTTPQSGSQSAKSAPASEGISEQGRLHISTPANLADEPEVTHSKMLVLAETAISETVETMAPARLHSIIEEMAPAKIANIFAETSKSYVGHAVNAFAPEKIQDLVDQIAPEMIEETVRKVVQDTVASEVQMRLQDELPIGLQDTVSQFVRSEMQGAFGMNVTRKVRLLIHDEIKQVFQPEA